MSSSPRQLRLLHLDLKTVYSYGDQLLFELVRHVFNGYGGGAYFDLTQTHPFRSGMTPSFVDEVNESFDGVVIGGGGLFPWRTNAARSSGWQWNITPELLKRLRVPIIGFGVGNAPQYSPERHNPVFKEHLNLVLERSVFFGARSAGAVESLRSYVDGVDDAPLTFQPCPTTLSRLLLPDVAPRKPQHERRLGLQFGLEQAHIDDGLTPERVYPQLVTLVRELQSDGWEVGFIGHKRADMGFFERHGEELGIAGHRLFGSTRVLFDGLGVYAGFPIVLGARGHSQMVPFGLGNTPLSFGTNDKIRFFAQHLGHPEWLVDPWADDIVSPALATVQAAHDDREATFRELQAAQGEFAATTLTNLATIYERITGVQVDAGLEPLTRRERALAQAAYTESYERRQLQERAATPPARPPVDADVRRAYELAAAGRIHEARQILARLRSDHPDGASVPRPRWDSGVLGRLPAAVVAPIHRLTTAVRRRRSGRSHAQEPAQGLR